MKIKFTLTVSRQQQENGLWEVSQEFDDNSGRKTVYSGISESQSLQLMEEMRSCFKRRIESIERVVRGNP